MTRDPTAWTRLGRAIRGDRERQGLSRDELAARVIARGGQITARTIGSLERGVAPKARDKPPSLEPTVAALGWPRGAADRILDGEEADALLQQPDDTEPRREERPSTLSRARVLELLPGVYEFSRGVVALGGDPKLRDRFDAAAQELLASMPASRSYALAAYRPHAEGEGPAEDDAERIKRALEREA
jgi:transcriptional regulator with XRE-family HTH domain